MIIRNITPSPWMLKEQAYIITSSLMELRDMVDPYGPQFPDPVIINVVHETVNDLINGNTEFIMEQLDEIAEGYADDEQVAGAVAELAEDLHEYMDMYKEVNPS